MKRIEIGVLFAQQRVDSSHGWKRLCKVKTALEKKNKGVPQTRPIASHSIQEFNVVKSDAGRLEDLYPFKGSRRNVGDGLFLYVVASNNPFFDDFPLE